MIFALFTKTELFDFSIHYELIRYSKTPSRKTHLRLFSAVNLFSIIVRQTFNIQGREYLTLRVQLSFLMTNKGAARFQPMAP
jgi:hypothetical protein